MSKSQVSKPKGERRGKEESTPRQERSVISREIRGLRSVTIKRFYSSSNLTAATAADVAVAYFQELAALPNYTEFAALFDQCRLVKWRIHVLPTQIGAEASPIPALYIASDPDDAVVPTRDTIQERTDLRIFALADGKQRVFNVQKPMFAVSAYRASAFTGYTSSDGWQDCGYPTIEWYGAKILWDTAGYLNTTSIVSIVHEVWWQFRCIK